MLLSRPDNAPAGLRLVHSLVELAPGLAMTLVSSEDAPESVWDANVLLSETALYIALPLTTKLETALLYFLWFLHFLPQQQFFPADLENRVSCSPFLSTHLHSLLFPILSHRSTLQRTAIMDRNRHLCYALSMRLTDYAKSMVLLIRA